MNLNDIIYNSQANLTKASDLSNLKKNFENLRRWYSAFFRGLIPDDLDAKILDIPCGHGNLLYFLENEGYRDVQGVDLTEGRVDVCRQLGLNATVDDGIKYLRETEDNSIDLIFSLDFLEHLPRDSAFEFIQICISKLKTGGKIFCRMPVTDNLFGPHDLYNDLTHQWSANSACIAQLFRVAGFTKVLVRDERPVLYKLGSSAILVGDFGYSPLI